MLIPDLRSDGTKSNYIEYCPLAVAVQVIIENA